MVVAPAEWSVLLAPLAKLILLIALLCAVLVVLVALVDFHLLIALLILASLPRVPESRAQNVCLTTVEVAMLYGTALTVGFSLLFSVALLLKPRPVLPECQRSSVTSTPVL